MASGSSDFTISTVDAEELLGATLYELNDHLGNVRIAMTQERTSVPFRTNLETEDGGGFENIHTRNNVEGTNHTPGGSWSAHLNPLRGEEYSVGPAISLMVSPGDTVKTTVYGMYTGEDENNTDVFPLIASFVASGFGFSSGLEGATTGLFEDLLTGAAAVPSPADAEVPKAYLKYFIFNREMQMTQHGHVLLDETALNNWQKLELEIPIQTNGYIYIYVANESMADVNVHFDDMEVTLIEGSAVNGADYYPFGLAMPGRSWSSEGYRFGYQGQFAEKDEETGWNAFELRMYDPVVGRWLSIDKYRQFASPYMGMGNNPIIGIDPDGGWVLAIMYTGRIQGAYPTASASIGIAVDGEGNVNVFIGGSAGAGFGIGASANLEVSYFHNLPATKNYLGWGFNLGAWIAYGVGGGLEVNSASVSSLIPEKLNEESISSWWEDLKLGATLGVPSTGPGIGLGYYADISYSHSILGFNIFETKENVEKYVRKKLDEYLEDKVVDEFVNSLNNLLPVIRHDMTNEVEHSGGPRLKR